MKIKRFFKMHYKKVLVSLICILFSLTLVLVASAQTLQYLMFDTYSSNRVEAYFTINEEGDRYYRNNIVATRDSVNNRFTCTLTDNNATSNDYLHRFDLVLNFNSKFELLKDDNVSFKFDLSANCEFVRDQGTAEIAFYYLYSFEVYFNTGYSFFWYAPYNPIAAYEVTDQSFDIPMGTLTENKGQILSMRWIFKLVDPVQFRSYNLSDVRSPYFNIWFNNSLVTEVIRDKATAPIYIAPNDSTLNDSLGIEDSLLNEVGGDLGKLNGLLSSSNVANEDIYKPITSFTYIFNLLFVNDNNIGNILERILRFSIAAGMSGFVLNIVVGIVSHFSAHSRNGTNNPKGKGGGG